ncbi:MAG: hypothetical protein RR973_02015 [Anaerovoracaceae bacterium]
MKELFHPCPCGGKNMGNDYKKHILNTELCDNSFTYWENDQVFVSCKMETYKNKGAIQYIAKNFLPSTQVAFQTEMEYRLVLLGFGENGVAHLDMGPIFVNKMGEGRTYQKFNCNNVDGKGNNIEKFSYCLMVATPRGEEKGQPITLTKTALPYLSEIKKVDYMETWREIAEATNKIENSDIFDKKNDETGSIWYIMNLDKKYPRLLDECKKQAEQYQHYIFGKTANAYFVGIPGRFFRGEQPFNGGNGFSLWQPLKGAEEIYGRIEDTTEEIREEIFGYWIAKIDMDSGDLIEV